MKNCNRRSSHGHCGSKRRKLASTKETQAKNVRYKLTLAYVNKLNKPSRHPSHHYLNVEQSRCVCKCVNMYRDHSAHRALEIFDRVIATALEFVFSRYCSFRSIQAKKYYHLSVQIQSLNANVSVVTGRCTITLITSQTLHTVPDISQSLFGEVLEKMK